MAANKQQAVAKKYFTLTQANAALPLVRAIVNDIVTLANDLKERRDRLARLQPPKKGSIAEAYQEELQHAQADSERDQERLLEYKQELEDLGVELKDWYIGLVDFPCWMVNREVCLCWRLGEADVAYWHEIDAGFAGRQKIKIQVSKT
jgi:hypothetical protein